MIAIRFRFKWIIVPLYYGSIICRVPKQCARELWGSCDVRKERLTYSSSCRACCQQKPWYYCPFVRRGEVPWLKRSTLAKATDTDGRNDWSTWVYKGPSLRPHLRTSLKHHWRANILLEGCPRLGQFLPQLRHHFSFCPSPNVAFRTLNKLLAKHYLKVCWGSSTHWETLWTGIFLRLTKEGFYFFMSLKWRKKWQVNWDTKQ